MFFYLLYLYSFRSSSFCYMRMSSIVCSVCGDKATSYLHYGARVCHSCRTFFRLVTMSMAMVVVITIYINRRTSVMLVRGKMKRSFFCCLRGGNCTVDLHTRKKCNYCRFDLLFVSIASFDSFLAAGLRSARQRECFLTGRRIKMVEGSLPRHI